jgi:hypothetical protein
MKIRLKRLARKYGVRVRDSCCGLDEHKIAVTHRRFGLMSNNRLFAGEPLIYSVNESIGRIPNRDLHYFEMNVIGA